MDDLTRLSQDPRVSIRGAGPPHPNGTCVVYCMQRAQRGIDNPALDVAVDAANALGKPVVVFFVSGHGFSRADADNDTTALATTVAPGVAPTRRLKPLNSA